MRWANGPAESFLVSSDDLRRLAESASFTVLEWLDGQDLIGRALVMPDFEPRMAALARNVENSAEQWSWPSAPRLE